MTTNNEENFFKINSNHTKVYYHFYELRIYYDMYYKIPETYKDHSDNEHYKTGHCCKLTILSKKNNTLNDPYKISTKIYYDEEIPETDLRDMIDGELKYETLSKLYECAKMQFKIQKDIVSLTLLKNMFTNVETHFIKKNYEQKDKAKSQTKKGN